MDNFTYENQGTNTYLVYTLAENEVLDSLSLGMITNNKISGLASTIFMQMNATKYIKFNISSKISLKQFFVGPMNRKKLLGVFNGIVDAMLSAEDYMIDMNSIIMDEDYIYVDVATCEVMMICLPVERSAQNDIDLNMFFKNIMFSIQFEQTENSDYVTKIINYLNSVYVFSLENFKELLKELTESSQSTVEKLEPKILSAQPVAEKPINTGACELPPPVKQSEPENKPSSSNEKPMSLLYLLRHYDKENINIYKSQKAEKKEQEASKTLSKKTKASVKTKSGKSKAHSNFAIPGQDGGNIDNFVPNASGRGVQAPVHNQQSVQTDALSLSRPGEQPIAVSADQRNQEADFGDTVYANGAEVPTETTETTMLGKKTSAEQQIKPHLIRKKNNERIPVNKSIFRLGRNREFNDYVVEENGYVGNSHCHIIAKGGEYFIVDDNSINHTYVDGNMIPSGSKFKITHGQSIKLADEEFEFRLF